MLPTFSIVVPTYNRPERLRSCLEALAELDYPPERYDVIVVDDGGSAPLEHLVAAVADRMSFRLLRQENAGPAKARNAGASVATGDYLAFTDDDCRPHRAWLRAFAAELEGTSRLLLGGRTTNELTENPFSSASQRLIDYLYQYYSTSGRGMPFFTSNNFALSRVEFLSIGGFDTSYRRAAGEDREFCDRWLHGGGRMEYVPSAVVKHAHDLTFESFLRQHFNYGRAAYAFHRDRSRTRQHVLKPEPVQFYLDLVMFPFRIDGHHRAWSEVLLLTVSQAANAAGYFWEMRIDSGDAQ